MTLCKFEILACAIWLWMVTMSLFPFRRFMHLEPSSLYALFAVLPRSRPSLSCDGFRRTYASLCDFYKLPFRDEVVWVRMMGFPRTGQSQNRSQMQSRNLRWAEVLERRPVSSLPVFIAISVCFRILRRYTHSTILQFYGWTISVICFQSNAAFLLLHT